MSVGHVSPIGDLIDHNTATGEADCVCGPDTVPVEADGGGVNWLIVHHSLDGREQQEGGAR
ncbi:hypothetical protein [Kitasatospora sp. NPDC087315]|uniref:hypothetical protein n=1 Tax=Kitasatospora sp. NPDC087315 TaxID=3364069 RepID=UPI0037F17935